MRLPADRSIETVRPLVKTLEPWCRRAARAFHGAASPGHVAGRPEAQRGWGQCTKPQRKKAVTGSPEAGR